MASQGALRISVLLYCFADRQSLLTLSFSILSCTIFSRAGLAAYRWLLRMSEASMCFPWRAMSLLANPLRIFLDKSNIIDLTLNRICPLSFII
jgi:hypothetical protein